jgi:hypothetical protein
VPANGIERLNPFAASETIENYEFLVVPIFRDDSPNRHARCFCGGITEKALSISVPSCDPALEVRADDRVIARLYN